MQDQNIASPAGRFLVRSVATGTGNPNSLQNLNTSVLPDGSMCFVTGNKTLYYLDKSLSSGGIAPSAGPGRWNIFDVAEAATGAAFLFSTAYNSFPVDGNWGTSTVSTFGLDTTSDSTWALTALGGILTYSGADQKFLVTEQASVEVGNVSAARDVFLGISKNDDLIGAPTGGSSTEVDGTISLVGQVLPMSTSRIVSLTAGDTLRPKMAGPAAATSLSAMIRMTLVPSA